MNNSISEERHSEVSAPILPAKANKEVQRKTPASHCSVKRKAEQKDVKSFNELIQEAQLIAAAVDCKGLAVGLIILNREHCFNFLEVYIVRI